MHPSHPVAPTGSSSFIGPEPMPLAARHHVSLAEVLSALSRALDITEGQPPGHTVRACAIAVRLADEIDLPPASREALYYAMLLKDAGCSSNAARMAMLFGSPDQRVKRGMKLVDWDRPIRLAVQTLRSVGEGASTRGKLSHLLRIARTGDVTRDLIAIRCDRGADIVRRIGFPEAAALAVRSLDEHWDGRGYPDGLRGEEIPILSRIALLAQTIEIFMSAKGPEAALRMARRRRDSWFDPSLVDRVLAWRSDALWWDSIRAPGLIERVIDAEPTAPKRAVDDSGLDRVAEAFAEIIDAKSPFTFRHSANVASIARDMAAVMGLDADTQRLVHRAGLLHDIGKLGVSNRILDKDGPLTAEERRLVERHPLFSWEILCRVDAFRDFAEPASLHHEKLDGSGYPWHRTGAGLEPAARILAVADIYEALTADRPYRAGMPPARALEIIRADAGSRLCARSVDALEAWTAARSPDAAGHCATDPPPRAPR